MCKDSIDAVLRNFGIHVPVHSIHQTTTQFECFHMSREYNQVYVYVKLFNRELPKSLQNVGNLRELLELGIFMLAIKKLAKNTIKKGNGSKENTIFF